MRVLLVSANTQRIKMTSLPLGLSMVATAVRQAGHETAFIFPHTPMAQLASEEGVIDGKDDLLQPQFCIRPRTETFIRETIARRQPPIPDN